MQKKHLRAFAFAVILVVLLGFTFSGKNPAQAAYSLEKRQANSQAPAAAPQQAATSIFRFPVVPGSTLSGNFDHAAQTGMVVFYDGRRNDPGAGFYFQCSNPSMYDWVGCVDPVAGEAACANNRELWYDNHHGTDFEYSPNWHTGAYCNPTKFTGITSPVYAPAKGQVHFAGYDASRPGNGWHIRLKHDLNGNGNYNDDNFRSIYLHFTANALAVVPGQIVEEGQYLGLGGSTGYSSSPHLHFEVQKSSDYFQSSVWSVDPYGWSGAGSDPWGYTNTRLWRSNVDYKNKVYLPQIVLEQAPVCVGCGNVLRNSGFESGRVDWIEQGVDIISSTSNPNLTVTPLSGSWLAWLGGRNNASDILYQDFTVPEGAVAGTLSYGFRLDTEESSGIYDTIYVRLRTTDGSLVQQLDYMDNTFLPRNQWLIREINLPDLSAYRNQNLRLSFEAATDSNLKTSFYVDEVSVTTSGP